VWRFAYRPEHPQIVSPFRRALPFAVLGLLTLGLAAAAPPTAVAPAPASAPPSAKSTVAPHAMVAAANPMAVEAGLKVLRAGGSAVDAAVAVQAALGLVEPQSSGLGGGSFMIFYDAKTRQVTAYNGRETAPAGATPDMFLGPDGQPMGRGVAMTSGRSAGVPGAVAMLHLAQSQHGKLKWSQLFAEPERLADQGFPAPRLMAASANSRAPQAQTPDAAAYFTKPDGTRIKQGDIVRNPA
jgi:gamma-glutamyltranspeptidase/glutathione hydrolase